MEFCKVYEITNEYINEKGFPVLSLNGDGSNITIVYDNEKNAIHCYKDDKHIISSLVGGECMKNLYSLYRSNEYVFSKYIENFVFAEILYVITVSKGVIKNMYLEDGTDNPCVSLFCLKIEKNIIEKGG